MLFPATWAKSNFSLILQSSCMSMYCFNFLISIVGSLYSSNQPLNLIFFHSSGLWGCSFTPHGWASQDWWWHIRVSQGMCSIFNSFCSGRFLMMTVVSFNVHVFSLKIKKKKRKDAPLLTNLASLLLKFLHKWQFYKSVSTGLKDVVWQAEANQGTRWLSDR